MPRGQHRGTASVDSLQDAAPGSDDCGHPRGARAHHGKTRLYGAVHDLGQVLLLASAPAKPAVVGDVDEHLGELVRDEDLSRYIL